MPIDLPGADAPLAAIDIGSNSFRLEIGQMLGGAYRRIDYLKETVRLGAGLDGQGLLGDEASERGLACLRRFAQRLQGMAPAQVRAVATQTLREATNRDAFLQQARLALGHPVEVISGREEARLIYSGVAHLQPGQLPRLVIDIGGRSTEMILGRGPTPTHAESFAVGCVSLTLQHFPEGRLSAGAFRAAQVAAGAELEEALTPFAPQHWKEALGSSGTAGAVSQILAANNIDKGLITPEGLRWLIERCLQAGHIDRLELAGLKDDRRAVLAGGLALLYTLAAQFGIRALQPARGALRQGVIIDLHDRHAAVRTPDRAARGAGGGDIRDATVRDLQRRFAVDAAQAARVRRVAMALYGAVAVNDNADGSIHSESDRELGWACDLHELGMMVSHHDHHRHSAYLLGHVDAAGFSQSQQWRLAALVLGQRGGLRKVEADLAQRAFALQVLALRLAVIKCHARGRVDSKVLRLESSGPQGLRLRFAPEWAATHPRTLYLLQQEAQAWARTGVLELALDAPAPETPAATAAA